MYMHVYLDRIDAKDDIKFWNSSDKPIVRNVNLKIAETELKSSLIILLRNYYSVIINNILK